MKENFKELYFERIGLKYDKNEPLDGALLKKIQYAHVTTIPYENIDIVKAIPLSLEIEMLFEKIVLRKRGGYCFELNALYAELLRRLGFSVESYMARFLRGEKEIPMRRHRVLLVTCPVNGEKYLCDVGVGSIAPRYPLPFELGVELAQFNETYRLKKDEFFGTVMEELHKGEWRNVFGFTFEKQLEIDYIMPSFYCEKHTDSIFNKDYMIAVKTKTGRKTLDKNVYKEFEGEQITLIKELDINNVNDCLAKQFGLRIE